MVKLNKHIFLLLMGLILLIPQVQAEWTDISPSVQITQTPQALDRVKRVLFSYVTITNTSAEALVDPVRLVITNPSIPVLNATGTTEAGDAYLDVAGGLSAGEKTTIRVDFQLARVKLVFSASIEIEKQEILKVGVFFDSPIQNISYTTSSGQIGQTNQKGEYFYQSGDEVEFFIGTLSLGKVAAKEFVTVYDMDNTAQVAMILQALDSDKNPENGINISADIQERFRAYAFRINEVDPEDNDFKEKFKGITGYDFIVDEVSALTHSLNYLKLFSVRHTDFYQYYIGNLSSISKELKESAEKRLWLYYHDHLISPRLEMMLKKIQVSINNTELSHDIFTANMFLLSEVAAISGITRLDDESLKKIINTQITLGAGFVKGYLIDDIKQKLYFEIKNPSIPVSDILVDVTDRFVSLAYSCSDALLKGGPASCYQAIGTESIKTIEAGYTAWKLSGEVKEWNNIQVASMYLREYFANAGDVNVLFEKYKVLTQEQLIEQIANEAITESIALFTSGDIRYDLGVVSDLIATFIKKLRLKLIL